MAGHDNGRRISARDYSAVDLSLRALRIFLAVEEAGSIVAAAERLGTSKSSVSQRISSLEQSLGSVLFDRASRPLGLTPAGSVLRRHAHQILNAVSGARVELMELNLSALPELRLAIIDDLDASITPELVEHLAGLYPQCLITASSGLSDELTHRIAERGADIVVTAEPPGDPRVFEVHRLLRDPFVLVCAKGALAPERDIRAQLDDLTFVRYSTAMPIGRGIEQHLRRVQVSPNGKLAFDASRSVFAMVEKCGGWAITTPLCLLDSPRARDSLEVHPLPFAGMVRTIHLVARRDELGELPAKLAVLARQLLAERLTLPALAIAPWLKGGFRVEYDGAMD
ncbi:MAG: LysR family transcriptional regulator [Pseudomonadota bacterium]